MVPEKYRLAAVGRFLVEQFELRRPGLKAWTPEVEAELRGQAEAELRQMQSQLREMEIDDPDYWRKVRGALDSVLIPRYAKLAQDEIALAAREYGIWRGGDLIARGVFALAGFLLGIIAVEVPYIPIYQKWFPALLLIAGPFFPDLVLWWYRRRFHNQLEALVRDLARAAESLETYRPLSELTRSLGMRADLSEGPASAGAAPDDRQRERS